MKSSHHHRAPKQFNDFFSCHCRTMNTNRPCGCKGFNSCYICEAEFGLTSTEPALERIDSLEEQRIFCPLCKHLYDPNDALPPNSHVCGTGECFPGIEIYTNFVSPEEEMRLLLDLDRVPWDMSQSGRRKQNYGPKANFKKRKVKVGSFQGFPKETRFIQDRFARIPSLCDYRTVEQCSIEYRPETGARIDPHVDDCWIWGERIVQLNLLSDSTLTLFPVTGDPYRYNLADVKTYPKVVNDQTCQVQFNPFVSDKWPTVPDSHFNLSSFEHLKRVIRVPLPRRSLLVLYGNPRYNWEHCILRRDISTRRIVIAYRELTPTYLPNGPEECVGREILAKAETFF